MPQYYKDYEAFEEDMRARRYSGEVPEIEREVINEYVIFVTILLDLISKVSVYIIQCRLDQPFTSEDGSHPSIYIQWNGLL